jgi:hypothetical protein
MVIPLTQISDSKRVAVDLSSVSTIEEYVNNGSKISKVNSNGTFQHHLFVKESIDQICEIANKINATNKNHQITIYYRQSQFD